MKRGLVVVVLLLVLGAVGAFLATRGPAGPWYESPRAASHLRGLEDDWYRSYVLKLGKLGLDVSPEIFVRARERLTKGLHHKQMLFGAASWPLHFWRFDPMTQTDFDWFEKHYPGWYDEYGMFWEAYAELQDPGEGYLLLKPFLEEAPPLCWTCQTPGVIDEDVC
ncbi:MAG: hypothetical protein ACAI25_02535, partial [Planctomycetota bacterium]